MNIDPIRGACDLCTRQIDGLGHQSEDGKLWHLSCWENIERAGGEDDTLKVFSVSVRFAGRIRVRIAARTEDEALELAEAQAEREVFDGDDFEADDADVVENAAPTERQTETYNRWRHAQDEFARNNAAIQRATRSTL